MDTLTMLPPLAPSTGQPSSPATESGHEANAPPVPKRRPGERSALLRAITGYVALLSLLTALVLARDAANFRGERYRLGTVTSGQVTGLLYASAALEPTDTVRVGAETGGRVSTIAVAVGEHVRRGQILARFDDREARAHADGSRADALASEVDLRHAELRLAQIVFALKRAMAAHDESALRPAEMLELESAALDAEATMARAAADQKKHSAASVVARSRLAGTVLRAPIDGVVVSRSVEPGETVASSPPGSPLFVIASDLAALRLVATVSAEDAGRVRPGRASFAVATRPGRLFDAMLVSVEPFMDGDTSSARYRVFLLVPNDDLELWPGLTATVAFPATSETEALLVPRAAVQQAPALPHETGSSEPSRQSAPGVWAIDKGAPKARWVPVDLGVTDGAFIEVRTSALLPGTRVLVNAPGTEL